MARNSVMRVRSVLVMALKHAQRRDIVARNVAELSEMPTSAGEARSGRSLQEYLASLLVELAARPAVEDVLARAQERARTTGSSVSIDDILSARDADRR